MAKPAAPPVSPHNLHSIRRYIRIGGFTIPDTGKRAEHSRCDRLRAGLPRKTAGAGKGLKRCAGKKTGKLVTQEENRKKRREQGKTRKGVPGKEGGKRTAEPGRKTGNTVTKGGEDNAEAAERGGNGERPAG